MQEVVADIVNNIIQDLINGGAQMNATAVELYCFRIENHKYLNVEHTALSKCLHQLHVLDVVHASCSKFLPILSNHGVPTYNDGGRCNGEKMLEIGLLSGHPDLAIGMI